MSTLPPGLDRLPSGRIRARYRDESGEQHSRTFEGVREAQRWRRSQMVAVDNGAHVSSADGRVTLREYAEAWRAGQVHRPSTASHVETQLRRHLYPYLGHRPIGAIRPSEVQSWVRRLGETSPDTRPLAPATVQVLHGILAGIFKSAVRDRRVVSNPCEGTRLPKREPIRVEPLATDVVEALAVAMPSRHAAAVLLAAGTGLRVSEVLGLTADRVDFLRRALTVDRQLVSVDRRRPYLGPPKTEASYRVVPLPTAVAEILAAHLAAYGTTDVDLIVGERGKERSVQLLFGNGRGGPVARTTFADRWRRAVVAAGAPEGTGFHALRHYYASLLIRHGESVKTVQARLGHATAAETLDTYAHLWPDSDDRTREAVDAVLGAQRAERVTTVSRGEASEA